MEQELCEDIMESWLKSSNRKLTKGQQAIVSKAFEKCRLPLYVKLVFEQVIHWKSADPVSQTILYHTVPSVINDLFKRLEVKHGEIFVSHALAYITASRSGLSESEWEDVLSLDDTVLEDVFQYHIPPVRRVPQVLLVRLLNDISNYVVTREADDRRVIFWYHRQFIETASSRFLRDLKVTTCIHKHLADYYSGEWHGVAKPFEYNQHQMKKLGLKSPSGSADRLVPAQPLAFSSTDGNNGHRYNMRKLNNLPWHLLQSDDLESLKKMCLLNLDFLQTKLRASGVHAILSDLQEVQRKRKGKFIARNMDVVVSTLKSALSETRASLNKKPDTLPIELSGRLLHLIHTNEDIRSLVKQCYMTSKLLPVTLCYPAPGGALTQTLEHKDLPIVGMEKYLFVENNGKSLLAFSEQNEIIVLDLVSGDVEREISLLDPKEGHKLNIIKRSADGDNLIAADAFQRQGNPVVIYNIKNDDITCVAHLEKVYKSVGFVDNFTLDVTSEYIVINIKDKEGDVFDMKGKHVHHFDQPATSMQLTLSGKTVIFASKEKCELSFFSLKKLDYWPKRLNIEDITSEQLLRMSSHSCRIFVGYMALKRIELVDLNEDAETAEVTSSLELGHHLDSKMSNIELSADDKYLLISAKMQVLMWDLAANKPPRKFVIPQEARSKFNVPIFKCVLCPNNNTLVMIHDERLLVFNVLDGSCLGHIHASKTPITELIGVSNSLVLTANRSNKLISVWNADDIQMHEREMFAPLSMPTSVRYLSAAKEDRYVSVRGYDAHDARVLNAVSGQFISHLPNHIDAMAPTITADGSYVVLTEYNSKSDAIYVCGAISGKIISAIPVSMLSFKFAEISQRGHLIATHSETSPTQDIKTQIWELETGKHVLDIKATTGGVSKMTFVDRNKFLVTLQQYPQINEGRHCTIHVYSLDNDGCELYKDDGYLKDMLFSIPYTNNVLVIKTAKVSAQEAQESNADETVILDVPNNKIIAQTKLNPTHLLHFSHNGKIRAIDSTLRVFDIENYTVIQDFHNLLDDKQSPKYRARITRDGKFAVWVSEMNGTLHVADVESGTLIAEAFTHALPQSLEVSDQGVIVIGCDDGRIMLLMIQHADKFGQDQSAREYIFRTRGIGHYDDVNRKRFQMASKAASNCCKIL